MTRDPHQQSSVHERLGTPNREPNFSLETPEIQFRDPVMTKDQVIPEPNLS